MTNNELLLAMSNMMDNKLKSELRPIKNDLQTLQNSMHTVKNDVQILKTELETVKDDVQTVKTELETVKDDVQILKTELEIVKAELETVKDNVQTLQTGLETVQGEVHQMKLCQENITLPRLNTIESCYTGTYNRYKDYADKMDSAFADIELVKQVVSEHSEKLQNIS